jgi:hypothetical protein
MRGLVALTVALALGSSAIPAVAQQQHRDVKPGTNTVREQDSSKLGTRSVTGTVKNTTANGLVIVGRESGQDEKEWAFALDTSTRIDAGGKPQAGALRAGDPVTVMFTDRDGKIVAQSIKVNSQ